MPKPDNLVLVQLRGLREALEMLAAEQAALDRRFDGIRLAVSGESFMGRCTAAEIEQRLDAIESRLQVLGGQA